MMQNAELELGNRSRNQNNHNLINLSKLIHYEQITLISKAYSGYLLYMLRFSQTLKN